MLGNRDSKTFVWIFRMNAKLHIDSCMIENSEAIMSDVYYVPEYVSQGNNHTFPIVKINGLYHYDNLKKTLHIDTNRTNF